MSSEMLMPIIDSTKYNKMILNLILSNIIQSNNDSNVSLPTDVRRSKSQLSFIVQNVKQCGRVSNIMLQYVISVLENVSEYNVIDLDITASFTSPPM